jgi:hypothetical protein
MKNMTDRLSHPLLGAAVAILLIATPASAQSPYRDGVPDVLTAPPPPPTLEDTTLGRFRSAYEARKRPRIAIFWNRALSDQTASHDRTETRIADRGGNGSTTLTKSTNGPTGTMTLAETKGNSSNTRTITTTTHPDAEPPRPGLAESPDFSAEAAFTQAFIQVGGQMIDRNVAMRTTAAGEGGRGRPDQQQAEARALIGKSDLLMEVLETPDPRGAVGFKWRLKITDIKSGRIVADFVTAGYPQDQMRAQWTAGGPKGFQKVTPQFSVDDVGRRVAVETMRTLLASWGGR